MSAGARVFASLFNVDLFGMVLSFSNGYVPELH